MVSKTKTVVRGGKISVTSAGGSSVRKKVIFKKQKAKNSLPSSKKRHLKVRDIKDSAKVRVVIKDNRKNSLASVPIARKQITPAILSPYRFPMPTSTCVAKVAGAFGMLFVLVGSGLSVLNMDIFNSVPVNVATISVSTDTNSTYGDVYDHKPEPVLNVSTDDVLRGNIPIAITVPFASNVQVILQSKTTGKLFSLGSAYKIDDTTWKREWNTIEFSDDEYRIKIHILNSYGSYDYSDSRSYIVENIDDGEVVTSIESTQDFQSDEEEQNTESIVTEHSTDVLLTVPTAGILKDSVSLAVRVWDASSVGVQAKNVKTGALYYVGHGAIKEEGLWRVTWNTNAVPDGTYEIFAKALVSSVQRESLHRIVTVDNILNEDNASTTTQNEAERTNDEILSSSDIEFSFTDSGTLSAFATLNIITPNSQWVEVYALKTNSLTPFFLGLAKKNTDASWTYVWQTTQSPNGDYYIYVRIKTSLGFVESKRISARITNEIISTFTSEQEDEISSLQTVSDTLIHIVDDEQNVDDENVQSEKNLVYIQSTENFVDTIDSDEDNRDSIVLILNEYRTNLNVELDALARARRTNDEEELKKIEQSIEELKNSLISSLALGVERTEIHEHISTYLSQITHELRDLTLKNEEILKERIGDAVHTDSDRDGVADYDEVNLYRTNPYTADTDGDGHNDGVEVAMGYNPHDDAREALIAYESPQERGVVRDDIFAINSISTLEADEPEGRPAALITGRGLPNSFITLYIYSTPIIVTVKTSADGSWSYILDKELEAGEHEVYVGVTDNAGRIVAKSNPLPFVKTAEAFVGGNTTRSSDKEIAQVEPSFYAQGPMLLVASVAVVALGLVLMLLGLHMTTGTKRDEQLIFS